MAGSGTEAMGHVDHVEAYEAPRRDFLKILTLATGAVASGAIAWPFIDALSPTREAEATAKPIINIGGMSAHIGSKNRAHVMTAKAGLIGFTRGLAHDLAAFHITANCVVPGAIDTARPGSSLTPAHHLTHGTITGERGKPDDIAAMVRFLCGPGGRYVTGQTIHISGGAFLGS